jgi:ubiquinone/menaquinone biosynthesis C-methylase UbiE
MGASTNRLLRSYAPSDIIGINISEKQLATCRRRAPGCRFLTMDATELRFPKDSLGNILCVEAAFHFDTREEFLREAQRVLKPGGCLALSDVLLSSKQSAHNAGKRAETTGWPLYSEKFWREVQPGRSCGRSRSTHGAVTCYSMIICSFRAQACRHAATRMPASRDGAAI